MLVNKGKPTDISTRQDREIRTYDFLDSLDIEYERVDHAPAETMEQCEKIDASLNKELNSIYNSLKNITNIHISGSGPTMFIINPDDELYDCLKKEYNDIFIEKVYTI